MILQPGLSSSRISHATVNCNILSVHVRSRRRGQVHHDTSDIFRLSQPFSWVVVLERVLSSQVFDQAIGKLRWEEARCYCVGRDVAWAELHRQLARQVVCSSFGDTVHDCAVFTHMRNRRTGCRRDDDDPGGVCACACFLEQRREAVPR